jgi:serine/threonine-protein kinase
MARRSPAHTFGQLAVEAGLLSETRLIELRKLQEDSERGGRPAPEMSDLALRKGYMTADQVRLMKRAEERLRRDERSREPARFGGYEILGKLGDGGLGTVYRARQISMGRIVALKVLHRKWMKDEEFKKRFLLEARLAGRMSHQNLIQVYDVGREKDQYYFSMEYVNGETAEDIVEREGPLEVDKALDIAIQVLRAVTYIWRYRIVHRDIKPGNIMLTRGGVAKLADFGFVKSKFDPILSTEGEVLGTPDYISPEQAMGETDIDFRSDIYSLGASIYHMVTGRPPFGGSTSEVMEKHVKEEPPDPQKYAPEAPEPVIHLIQRMMAKDPDERYSSTQELFEDIELVRMGQDPAGDRPEAGKATILRAFKIEKTRIERMQEEVRSLKVNLSRTRKLLWAALACAGLLLVGLVLALVVL